jgi:hypothetical protein
MRTVSGIKSCEGLDAPLSRCEATYGAYFAGKKKRTFSSTRLDDEDILSTNTLFDLNTRLTALELVK